MCALSDFYSSRYIPAPIRLFHDRWRERRAASPLGDTRICRCQSAQGGINYSNQRVPGPIRNLWRAHAHPGPYVRPKWKDRLARLAVKTSTLVPCVDAYAKSASSVHSQRHPCALTVVHHFWLHGVVCCWKGEREKRRKIYTYYSERR